MLATQITHSVSDASYRRLAAKVDRLVLKAQQTADPEAAQELRYEAKYINEELAMAGRCTRYI